MAASASPTCRIAARCCACRPASMAGSRRTRRRWDIGDFARLFAEAGGIEILLVGTGKELRPMPPSRCGSASGGRHFGRPDGDGRRGAHLQRAARRGPRRRRGADRGRLEPDDPDRDADQAIGAGPGRRPRPLLSALYAPADKRRSLFALYAFNAEIARIRDRIREPLPGEIRLQWWRDAIARRSERRRQGIRSPKRCWRRSSRCSLPHKAVRRLSRGAHLRPLRRSDADARRLEGYCGETASALIQLAAIDPRAAGGRPAARSGRPCRLRAGDHRAAPADPAASRARPMLRAQGYACRRRDVARGVRRRRRRTCRAARGCGDDSAGAASIWRRSRRCWSACRRRCARPFCRWR